MNDWYQDPDFWNTTSPLMFHEDRFKQGIREVAAILEFLGLEQRDELVALDMPSGPGRHSLPLAKHGVLVTAVDLNEAYLESLRQAAGDLPIQTIAGDMRHVVLPENSFDLALNLFSSIGYFEDRMDDERVFERAFRALKPGGWLVIDTTSLEIVARRFTPIRFVEVDGYVVEERTKIVDDWSRIEVSLRIRQGRKAKDVTFRTWLYGAAELGAILRRCGFGRVKVCADYYGRTFDQEAKRLVIYAEKPIS